MRFEESSTCKEVNDRVAIQVTGLVTIECVEKLQTRLLDESESLGMSSDLVVLISMSSENINSTCLAPERILYELLVCFRVVLPITELF